MSVTALVQVGTAGADHPDGLLAAFAGEEVRGVAQAMVLSGKAYFFLTLYADGAGETISFRYYDPAADLIRDLDETVTFAVNGVVGSPSPEGALQLHAPGETVDPLDDPANWSVDPAQFESSMSVTAAVFVGGVRAAHADDRLVAIIDGVVHGVVAPLSAGGQMYFFLTVYGNGTTSGQTITFRYYDAQAGLVRHLEETTAFAVNGTVGTLADPLALHAPGEAVDPLDDPANWSVDPAQFESSMIVIGVVEDAAGWRTSTEAMPDRVLAEVNGQVRGVATWDPDLGRFYLLVYANASGETVHFRYYDAAADTVHHLEETVTFAVNGQVGTHAAPLVWWVAGTTPAVFDDPTLWTIDPPGYEFSMNLTAQVRRAGVEMGAGADLLAAFVGNEVRGMVTPQAVGSDWRSFLTVYSQTASGEEVVFYYYEAAQEHVYRLTETRPFVSNAVEGSIAAPAALNVAAFPVTLGGRVLQDGAGVQGLTVQLKQADAVVATTTTAADGRFSFQVETDGGAYTIEPVHASMHFSPGRIALGALVADVDVVFFATATEAGPTAEVRSMHRVEPSGREISLTGGGRVRFPAGALAAGRLIQVGRFTTPPPGADVVGEMLFLGPSGLTFDAPIEVVLPCPADHDAPETLQVVRYDEAAGTYEPLATTRYEDATTCTLTAETTRFSGYGAAVVPGVSLSLRLLLQGAYTGGSLSTSLNAEGHLPTAHPYAGYAGTESVAADFFDTHPTIVDWVLVELRTGTAAATHVATRAALLKSDGHVVDLDGTSAVAFSEAPGSYYVVVRHRNHLPVMSAAAVDCSAGSGTYDLTTGAAQAYGTNALKELAAGVYGLYAGDGDGSGGITAADQAAWLQVNGLNGYQTGDYDLSGGATAADQAVWLSNNGINSQVPQE